MRLLVVTQYFWPESFTINDLVRVLRDQGHDIVVVTGKPNYPEGNIFPGYSARGVQKELFAGNIEVLRVPLRPRGKNRARDLFLNYLSFVWSGLRWFPWLLRGRSFDAILVFAGSPNVSIPALPMKWFKKAHLALWVLDLWPESLEATGFVRNRTILKLVGLVVRAIYSVAGTILVQSMAFKKPVARYAKMEKIIYYPNSIDISTNAQDGPSLLPASLLDVLKNYFCVVFTGNIGTAQAVDTLIQAMVLLKDLSDLKMVMVGSGSLSDWVSQKKEELGLDNLVLAGRFPMNAMPEIYQHAACLVVTLKDREIFSYTIPGKVQAYLAAGKPIVAALNGEGARVIAEAGAGLTCAAEDHASLATHIRSIYGMPALERAKLGAAGRRYFLKHFDMQGQARNLIEILEKRIATQRSPEACLC